VAAAAAVATKKVATIAAVAAVDTTEIINTLLPTTYINPSGFRKDFLCPLPLKGEGKTANVKSVIRSRRHFSFMQLIANFE
jgi:hypothetical protein